MTMESGAIQLSPDLAERLRSIPTPGEGGYQSLVRQLQQRLEGNQLRLDEQMRERMEHYAYDFGRGGWQLFLREILDQAEATRVGA